MDEHREERREERREESEGNAYTYRCRATPLYINYGDTTSFAQQCNLLHLSLRYY